MMGKRTTDTVDVDILLWNILNKDDEHSFRLLFESYYPALCIYAKRFIEAKETREDMVQDVFFSIWENRRFLSVETSARSYLVVAVRNHCLNFLRHDRVQSCDFSLPESLPLYAENNDDLYTLAELRELLAKALSKLPEEYRRVFELNRFEEKSYGEIAETMHVSVRTVERYKNKAIEILKKELKDYLPAVIGWML